MKRIVVLDKYGRKKWLEVSLMSCGVHDAARLSEHLEGRSL